MRLILVNALNFLRAKKLSSEILTESEAEKSELNRIKK